MSREKFTDVPGDRILEPAEETAYEDDQYGLDLTRSLGMLANGQIEIIDPSLKPGSSAAKAYARDTGVSGMQRWMEPFSKFDILGMPTVFSSDNFGQSDRRI